MLVHCLAKTQILIVFNGAQLSLKCLQLNNCINYLLHHMSTLVKVSTSTCIRVDRNKMIQCSQTCPSFPFLRFIYVFVCEGCSGWTERSLQSVGGRKGHIWPGGATRSVTSQTEASKSHLSNNNHKKSGFFFTSSFNKTSARAKIKNQAWSFFPPPLICLHIWVRSPLRLLAHRTPHNKRRLIKKKKVVFKRSTAFKQRHA